MTYLASDAIAETRQHFLGGIREQKNKLAANLTTGDTSVTLSYDLGQIDSGVVLTIGLERIYVWTGSGMTASAVQRGYDGTTAAVHTAGDLVAVNSRCDDFAIFRALNNELAALSSPSPTKGLFRPRSVDVSYNPSTYGYDLASAGTIIGRPISVSAEGTGTGQWDPLPAIDWRFEANADTTDFPSGQAIFTSIGSAGLRLRVLYKAPFVALSALTTDLNTVSFLPASANDIPPMGAALRLAAGRPMQRADLEAQGSTRRADEATTQDALIAAGGLRATYNARVLDEAMRLSALYPDSV